MRETEIKKYESLFKDVASVRKELNDKGNEKHAIELEITKCQDILSKLKIQLERVRQDHASKLRKSEASFNRIVEQENGRFKNKEATLNETEQRQTETKRFLHNRESIIGEAQRVKEKYEKLTIELEQIKKNLEQQISQAEIREAEAEKLIKANLIKEEALKKDAELMRQREQVCSDAEQSLTEDNRLKKKELNEKEKSLQTQATFLFEKAKDLDGREAEIIKIEDRQKAKAKEQATTEKNLNDKDTNLKNLQKELEFAAAKIKSMKNK